MHDLYLDPSTRVAVNLLPTGTSWPAPRPLTLVQVGDADAQRIHDDWVQASNAGLQLVVAADLTTSTITPAPSAQQQAFALLRDYLANASPTQADSVAALKTLIRVVRGLLT
jgi:hypothetical protein